MKTTYALTLAILLMTPAFAGCLGLGDGGAPGGDAADAPELVTARHTESSERTVAEVTHVSGDVTYGDLRVVVNENSYRFGGEDASYQERRYAVEGASSADDPVRIGDRLTIPAVDFVEVQFLHVASGTVLYSYETTIPDETSPKAPVHEAPEDGATGVSRTPELTWQRSLDPSGVTYTVEVSLDENFESPFVTTRQRHIASTSFTPQDGDELLPGQTYYWHVRAVDGAGNQGPWSLTSSFTVGAAD